jgi:hypothetical protein
VSLVEAFFWFGNLGDNESSGAIKKNLCHPDPIDEPLDILDPKIRGWCLHVKDGGKGRSTDETFRPEENLNIRNSFLEISYDGKELGHGGIHVGAIGEMFSSEIELIL